MKKALLIFLILIMVLFTLASCSSTDKKVIAENESTNKEFISASVSAMNDQQLSMIDNLEWGDNYKKIKKVIHEPYINDNGQYLSTAFFAALPADSKWSNKDGKINANSFVSADILSYFVSDEAIGLCEYGYLIHDVNLYQYDFLKSYYTKKFGEPAKEEWEWKNKNYDPVGDENYYLEFAEGKVKVLTVWDLKELDSVLVIDWLNDPQNEDNNYGQISFYDRTDDFSLEETGDGNE